MVSWLPLLWSCALRQACAQIARVKCFCVGRASQVQCDCHWSLSYAAANRDPVAKARLHARFSRFHRSGRVGGRGVLAEF